LINVGDKAIPTSVFIFVRVTMKERHIENTTDRILDTLYPNVLVTCYKFIEKLRLLIFWRLQCI